MKEKKPRKTDPPLHLDMEFGEALQRFVQTKPEEVEAPKGREKKARRKRVDIESAQASEKAPL